MNKGWFQYIIELNTMDIHASTTVYEDFVECGEDAIYMVKSLKEERNEGYTFRIRKLNLKPKSND